MTGKDAWKPFVKFVYQKLLPAGLRNKVYRYPSPDAQVKGVCVPSSDSKDSIYNINYYTRDIRRFPFPIAVGMHPSIPVEKRVEIPADAKRGSPGNKNPAVLSYDSTGTRSAMSTTNVARDKLILQHVSTHNVRFEWEGDAEKEILAAECEAKTPFVWNFPSQGLVMRW